MDHQRHLGHQDTESSQEGPEHTVPGARPGSVLHQTAQSVHCRDRRPECRHCLGSFAEIRPRAHQKLIGTRTECGRERERAGIGADWKAGCCSSCCLLSSGIPLHARFVFWKVIGLPAQITTNWLFVTSRKLVNLTLSFCKMQSRGYGMAATQPSICFLAFVFRHSELAETLFDS
uniref:Uncharacterized protein n=1 Tax=Micrurus spixii TaxID=129469 RepID=A0A2D4M1I6_9SAUR